MSGQNVRDIFEPFTPTAEKKDELLNQILMKNREEKNKSFAPIKRLSPAFIITVLIVCFTTVTALALNLGWNEKLIEYLNPSEKQIEELAGAVTTPLATVSQSGVTVEIKQTIADTQGVYILYDMTVPEWLELNDDIVFLDRRLSLRAGHSEKVIEQNKNKRTTLIYSRVNGREMPQKLKVEFGDLGYFDNDFQFNAVIEGHWTLEFDFNYIDATQTIDVNKKIDINGTNNNTITKIYISPMSILINIEGDDLWTAFLPVIKFKNGDEIKIEAVNDFNTSYSFHNLPEKATYNDDGSVRRYGVYSISRRFDRITDISEIESIIIGDVTIPIN